MPNANKSILLSCVYNEQHLIGLKMVADVFERHGWHTNILGGNTPTKDLIDMALIMKPDIIALSLTLYFNIDNLYDMINQIRKFIPDTLIIIGGQAFTRLNTENRKEFYNVKYFNDLYSIEEFVINLKGKI
jgi:methanogenic corrinoid protein MtbC1